MIFYLLSANRKLKQLQQMRVQRTQQRRVLFERHQQRFQIDRRRQNQIVFHL